MKEPLIFLPHQISDIRNLFDHAKHKRKEVEIIAQLYDVKKSDIMGVLTEEQRAIASTGPEHKAAVIQAVLDGMGTHAAAEKFGHSPLTVRKWVLDAGAN